MSVYDFDLGILGGGSAGLTVAAGAAQFGAKTLLVEREGRLGGDCLHYGCVPSKTLIKTARVYHLLRTAAAFGLPHVDAPAVNFRDVSRRIRSVIDTIQRHDSAERFCGLGARVEFGAAEFRDEYSVLLNGRGYSAKAWVIATGSSPAIPPVEGLAETPYLTNRDIFYLDKLPTSMIFLGGGPISIEMAQAFSRLGTKVTVVQRGDQILSREDKDMADSLMACLNSEGVTFHLNVSVERAKDLGKEREVVIRTKEGASTVLKAETIMVAVGREANLDGLGLEKIGVEFDRTGLKLDKRLRTTRKHLYGAGDVTGSHQFTHAAGYEGGIVLTNAVLHLPRRVDYTFLPWCTYTDPELASIGMNEKRAQEEGIAYSVWTEEFMMNDRGLAEGDTPGRIKMILSERKRPIGVQILGPHAGELIGEWVASMNGRVKLSTIASAVHPYPTFGEISKKVVGKYFSGRIFSEKMKKALRLFFNLRGRAC